MRRGFLCLSKEGILSSLMLYGQLNDITMARFFAQKPTSSFEKAYSGTEINHTSNISASSNPVIDDKLKGFELNWDNLMQGNCELLRKIGFPTDKKVYTQCCYKVLQDSNVRNKSFVGFNEIFCATQSIEIIKLLQKVSARCLTKSSRFDGLQLRSPAMQKRISQLSASIYALESLSEYVSYQYMQELDNNQNPQLNSHSDSLALGFFTIHSLTDSLSASRMILSDSPNLSKSPEEEFAKEILSISPWDLLRKLSVGEKNNSDFEMTHHSFFNDICEAKMLLNKPISPEMAYNAGSKIENNTFPIYNLFSDVSLFFTNLLKGFRNRVEVRLTSPHLNVRMLSDYVENDIQSFLNLIKSCSPMLLTQIGIGKFPNEIEIAKSIYDSLVLETIAYYGSQLLANIAVIYRCSGELSHDSESFYAQKGWVMAQIFTEFSREKRRNILDNFFSASKIKKCLNNHEYRQELNNYYDKGKDFLDCESLRHEKTSPSDNNMVDPPNINLLHKVSKAC